MRWDVSVITTDSVLNDLSPVFRLGGSGLLSLASETHLYMMEIVYLML